MTTILIIGIVLMIVGIIVLIRQNIQEGLDDSGREVERYQRKHSGISTIEEKLRSAYAQASEARSASLGEKESQNRTEYTKRTTASRKEPSRTYKKNLDGTDKQKRRRTRRIGLWAACIAFLISFFGNIAGTMNFSNLNLEHIGGGEDIVYNDDGSIQSRKEYNSLGLCIYEFQDMGDFTRETEYDEDGLKVREREYDSEGVILIHRSYTNGYVTYEERYEGGLLSELRAYHSFGSDDDPALSDVIYYDADGHVTYEERYDLDGELSEISTWDGNRSETITYESGELEWKYEYIFGDDEYLRQCNYYEYENEEWVRIGTQLGILLPEEQGIPMGESDMYSSFDDLQVLWAVGSFDEDMTLQDVYLYLINRDEDDPEDYLDPYETFWYGSEEDWMFPEDYEVEYDEQGEPVSFRYVGGQYEF